MTDEQLAFLLKHHDGNAHQSFGLRRDTEDVVDLHRIARFSVPMSKGLMEHDLAPSGDQDHRAGQSPLLDVPFRTSRRNAIQRPASLGTVPSGGTAPRSGTGRC